MKTIYLVIAGVLILIAMHLLSSYAFKKYELPYYKETVGPNRTIIHFTDSSLEVDNALLYYTESYIKSAIDAGIDVPELSKNLLGLYIELIPVNRWGVTMKNSQGQYFILISTAVTTENKLRLVIFHELTHYYLLPNGEHCHEVCGDIMSGEAGFNNFYRNWEQQKAILFNAEL
tara:strand:- start:51 stop:572 length:522 start_codon:yes stop_codon:yes gene_type:complete